MAEMPVPVQPLSEERSHTPDSEDSACNAQSSWRDEPIPRRDKAADCPLLSAVKKSADGTRAAEARAVAAAERAAKAEKGAAKAEKAAQRSRRTAATHSQRARESAPPPGMGF